MSGIEVGLALLLQLSGMVIKRGADVIQPLANARVELLDGPSRQVVRTDGGGHFAFTNLLYGNYRVSVTRDGFIRQEYGQRIPNGPSSRIQIGGTHPVDDLVFLMQPAPTITGWVRDEYGEVVPGVLIQASRKGYDARGKRTIIPVASTLSDDHGQYRLYWLDPGDYIVSAGSASPAGSVYLQTYYPGFDDPGNAELVTLKVGREVPGIDFKVVRGAPIEVGGFVVTSGGTFPRASVTLQPPGDVASSLRFTGQTLDPNRARGEFKIPDVTPGRFIVSAQTTSGERYSGSTTITVRNGKFSPPMMNVRVVMGPSVEVKGNLARDGDADFSKTRIALTSLEPVLPSIAPFIVQPDGRFSISGVQPGTYMLSITGLPENAYIKDATEFLEIEPGSTPGPVTVAVGLQGGQLTGTIVDATGQPRFGAQIVLVPEGDRRERPNQYLLAGSDAEGKFAIRGIPPGDYKVFAWEVIEPYAYLNADFIKSYEPQGTRVRIAAGGRVSLRVRMIPDEP